MSTGKPVLKPPPGQLKAPSSSNISLGLPASSSIRGDSGIGKCGVVDPSGSNRNSKSAYLPTFLTSFAGRSPPPKSSSAWQYQLLGQSEQVRFENRGGFIQGDDDDDDDYGLLISEEDCEDNSGGSRKSTSNDMKLLSSSTVSIILNE